MTTVAADDDHPYLASKPTDWTLTLWATVLDRDGHQAAHVHPTGWLSGVYYVAVPEPAPDAPEKSGWIEFGRPPDELGLRRDPSVHALGPTPGLMLLFPSYFYHRTMPFTGAGQRVSIAFDLMPNEQAAEAMSPGQLSEAELTAELERVSQLMREMHVNEAATLDQAMHYYHRGNRRKRALTDFSIEAERANIRRIIGSFGPEVFERFAGSGDPQRAARIHHRHAPLRDHAR